MVRETSFRSAHRCGRGDESVKSSCRDGHRAGPVEAAGLTRSLRHSLEPVLRRVGLPTLVVAAVLFVGAPAVTHGSQALKSFGHACGSFTTHYGSDKYRFKVRAQKVPCVRARFIAHDFASHSNRWHQHGDGTTATTSWTRFGWRCAHGTDGGGCRAQDDPGKRLLYQLKR